MRQRPQPKREVPSQPTPARSSGSCSPWHLPSRLQLAVPAFSAVQQLQPRDRRGAGHLVLCSPPSYLHLILIHTAIHAIGNAVYCTALHWSPVSSGRASQPTSATAFPPPSTHQITRERAEMLSLQGHPNCRIQRGAGRKIASQCTWLARRLPNSICGRGSRDALLNPDMGTPPLIHRAHRHEIDASSSILPPRAYFSGQ